MSQATLTLPDGITIRNIPCTAIVVGGKKNIDAKPNANIDGPVEAQTNAYENLKIQVQGLYITGNINDITYADILTLYKHKFTGTNAAKLNVIYGDDTNLIGTEESSDIYVVLDSFNVPFDQKDSKNAYRPVGSLTFTETDTQ